MENKKKSKYSSIMEALFLEGYTPGAVSVAFTRDHLIKCANNLGISIPKNLGDVIYSFRYRSSLPESIQKTAPEGMEWIIVGTGSANYEFRLCNKSNILPNPNLENIPIPNNTPEIISMYQLSDEQSLLCKIRYNRMLDIFLGIATYSMQNHLRTQVPGIGQIEIDELYVGVNKQGQHFVMPVEAKVGNDMVGVVQLMQDIKYCEMRFPDLICVPVAVHKMESENDLCMFRLKLEGDSVKIVDEKHYKLLPAGEVERSVIAERNRRL